MRRKHLIYFTSFILVFCLFLSLMGCGIGGGEVESYFNLATDGTIYFDGEQTVTLGFSEYSQDKTEFKSDISAEDISLTGVLAGKKVKSVSFTDKDTVSLTVYGKVTAEKAVTGEYGVITVSENALANGAKGNCYVNVNFNPEITAYYISSTTGGSNKYISEFSLPYGFFISENINGTNIIVPGDGITVNVSLTEDNALRVEVTGFVPYTGTDGKTYDYPVAKIGANVTSFNKELYVYIGIYYSAALV